MCLRAHAHLCPVLRSPAAFAPSSSSSSGGKDGGDVPAYSLVVEGIENRVSAAVGPTMFIPGREGGSYCYCGDTGVFAWPALSSCAGWHLLPTSANRKAAARSAKIRAVCLRLVQERRAARAKDTAARAKSSTLLDLLLDARDESAATAAASLTDDEVVDQAATFLIAGAHTARPWELPLRAIDVCALPSHPRPRDDDPGGDVGHVPAVTAPRVAGGWVGHVPPIAAVDKVLSQRSSSSYL